MPFAFKVLLVLNRLSIFQHEQWLANYNLNSPEFTTFFYICFVGVTDAPRRKLVCNLPRKCYGIQRYTSAKRFYPAQAILVNNEDAYA